MVGSRPKTPDEDIGIRALQTKRARAVETTLGRMRHGLGHDWTTLSNSQIEELSRILGEIWAYVARDIWQELHFGLLSVDEVHVLLELGKRAADSSTSTVETLDEMVRLVQAKG